MGSDSKEVQALKERLQKERHLRTEGSARWGYFKNGTILPIRYVCFAGLYDLSNTVAQTKNPVGFYSVYQGLRKDFDKYHDYTNQLYKMESEDKFISDQRSLRWVQYLLSDISPYAALHPFLYERDPEWVNQNGFVSEDISNAPCMLLLNFLQAARKSYEFPEQFKFWLQLTDEGMDPRMADFLSSALVPTDKSRKTWVYGNWWSGHCHLRHSRIESYFLRYTQSQPCPDKLTKTFKNTLHNPGGNADIWKTKDITIPHEFTVRSDQLHQAIERFEQAAAG